MSLYVTESVVRPGKTEGRFRIKWRFRIVEDSTPAEKAAIIHVSAYRYSSKEEAEKAAVNWIIVKSEHEAGFYG